MGVFDKFLDIMKLNDDDYDDDFYDEEDEYFDDEEFDEKPARRSLFGKKNTKEESFDDFDMEEEKKTDKNIERQLLHIIDDLNAGKNMIARVTEEDRAAHQQFLERMNQTLPRLWQHLFKITEHCIGCGICQKVCPSASTQLMEGTAVYFSGNCQTCLACVHACPQKAIALTIPEKNPRARYRNEHISLQEIISANCQFSSR